MNFFVVLMQCKLFLIYNSIYCNEKKKIEKKLHILKKKVKHRGTKNILKGKIFQV